MNKNAPAIELWEIGKLTPYAKNAKIHSKQQVAVLAGLIKRHGWTQPIVVDRDGVIIIGHGRRLAAQHLRLSKVPVIHRSDLSVDDDESKALRIADNQSAGKEYDTELLRIEITELQASDYEGLSEMGFDEKELEFFTNDLGALDGDAFVDDIAGAVDEQRAENAKKEEETDASAAPIADALGFKRCTIAESRELRGHMARIERETGKSGAAALIAHFSAGASVNAD